MKTGIVRSFAYALSLASFASSAWSFDIPETKRTSQGLYLTAIEAADFLEDPEVVFIDIRSHAEVAFLGLPSRVDRHIPYMELPADAAFDGEKGTYALEPNPDFAAEFELFAMESGIWSDDPIVLICRSGSRSARAATLLGQLGYNRVYTVIDGYEGDTAKDGPDKGRRVVNGWKNAGLGWSYRVTPHQATDAGF